MKKGVLRKKTAFLSIPFLIVMITTLHYFVAFEEHLLSANRVYQNMEEYRKDFLTESAVLLKVKCMLLNGEEMDDFFIGDTMVEVFEREGGKYLVVDRFGMELKIVDNKIYDYDIIPFDK